jgi:hypothetical protein
MELKNVKKNRLQQLQTVFRDNIEAGTGIETTGTKRILDARWKDGETKYTQRIRTAY